MAIQTAAASLILALTIVIDCNQKHLLGHLLDFLIILLIWILFTLVLGYLYEIFPLTGQSNDVRTSPHTVLCLGLLTFVQITRRIQNGLFAPFISLGLGGHIVRVVFPGAIAFILFTIYTSITIFAAEYPIASSTIIIVSSSIITILFYIILLLGKHVNSIESSLREASIIDELTKIKNYRGFIFLGRQVLANAKRYKLPITLAYLDVDNLKMINDEFGHEAGSQILCKIALLLNLTFRDADVIGRIGGDEFSILTSGVNSDLAIPLNRFENMLEQINQSKNEPYQLSCSIGVITITAHDNLSIEHLLSKADAEMYKVKKKRHS